MQQLPEMYNQSSGSDGILGPAVKAGMEALKVERERESLLS